MHDLTRASVAIQRNDALVLERAELIAELESLRRRATSGAGAVALVAGEAGVGKSTLVTSFLRTLTHGRVLHGSCDNLFTPRPLGPLHDIARTLRGELLRHLIEEASRPVIFGALLDALAAAPAVVLIEDIHWADEASLDLLKFLGRRIATTPTLLIVTYRDEMIGSRHPLRSVLGDLPQALTHRLHVPPLSRTAVSRLLDQAGRRGERIYERTGGNPFYVTELLASPAGMPESVRDAVLARAQALSPAAQRALEIASIVPGRIARWLLVELLDQPHESVVECVSAGMLCDLEDAFAFRHELAREAIEASMTPESRQRLHGRALAALAARSRGSLAQFVHHAEAAGDSEAVLQYAPEAAREAAALGGHHEAVAHLRSALRHADPLDPAARADLLEACSYECYLTGDIDAAFGHREDALAIALELEDLRREGDSLRWLSRLAWFRGDRVGAESYADRAIAVLERRGANDEALAWAYSNRAQLHMLAGSLRGARPLGERAVALATEIGSQEIRCHALNNLGTVLYSVGRDTAGRAMLLESLEIALAHEFDEHAARAYTNLSSVACWHREYAAARQFLEAGIAYCSERDLDTWRDYMLGWRAKLRFEQGDWPGARTDAVSVLAREGQAAMLVLPAVLTLMRLGVRAGEPDAAERISQGRTLAAPTRESQRILPVAAAAAEFAWYEQDAPSMIAAVRGALPSARRDVAPWETGELLYWLELAGDERPDGFELAEPWEHVLAGDWRAGADAFAALGCQFEQALALMRGDAEARRRALTLFDELGAARAAARLRHELRSAGERSLPRGPRNSTRSHPAGLTRRQADVLSLLAAGMTDRQIARKLHLSIKTVGHHVSAILAKLEVGSRNEAAEHARRSGLLDDA